MKNRFSKRFISIVACACMLVGIASISSATSMHSTTSTSYTTASSARDVNNYYSFTQGSVVWSGKTANQWPSGARIYYAPFSQDGTQCGSFVGLTSGASSGSIQYWSGKGYKANYRIGSYTSTSSVDTNFSFYE